MTMRNDPSRHWSLLTPFVSGPVLAEQARSLESAGLAGVAFPQIYGAPWVPLGYCAAVTSRLALQSGVLPAFSRSPFETALTAVDLDRICGGRFVLGMGPSYREWNRDWYGMPDWGQPVAHLRETIEVIRMVVRKAHTGELDRYDGVYHRHDWSSFPGTAPPLRTEIPIWIAANRLGLVRLAGEIADGLMSHAMWSVEWTLRKGHLALLAAIARAGRERSSFHWQAAYWVAVNDDRREAIADARTTVAWYAGLPQFQPYFAAHGFEAEAKACQAAIARKDVSGAAAAVPDAMAETFVILGSADECRRKLEPIWTIADSFMLIPPVWGLSPEKIEVYASAIARTFFA